MFALALALALAALACGPESATDEGVTDEGADEGALRAGNQLSEAEVASLVARAGFAESEIPRMVCTAKYESGFYERASHRNRNGTVDRGLFQVNSVHLQGTPGCPRSADALFDAATNARCAFSIYSLQGIGAWYGYRAHRSECDRYSLDGAASVPSPGASPTPSKPSTPTPASTSSGGDCVFPTFSMHYADCLFLRSQGRWLQCVGGQLAEGTYQGAAAGYCHQTYVAD